jgi:hypothetical protein
MLVQTSGGVPVSSTIVTGSDGQKCIAGIGIFQYYSQCHIASPTGIAVHAGTPSGIAVITAPVQILFLANSVKFSLAEQLFSSVRTRLTSTLRNHS